MWEDVFWPQWSNFLLWFFFPPYTTFHLAENIQENKWEKKFTFTIISQYIHQGKYMVHTKHCQRWLVFSLWNIESCIWKPKCEPKAQRKGWSCWVVVLKWVMAGGHNMSWCLAAWPASSQASEFQEAVPAPSWKRLEHSLCPALCCHRCLWSTRAMLCSHCLLKGRAVRWCKPWGGHAWAGSCSQQNALGLRQNFPLPT